MNETNTPHESSDAALNVDLIEASFNLLAPRADELVARFYDNLFAVAPGVRSLFPDDLAGHRRALLGAIGMIVNSIRSPEKLGPYLEGLGDRHVGYGAVEGHYDVVGSVLLTTMAEMAGAAWNDELQETWTSAFGVIKQTMLAGAEAHAQAA